MKSRKFKAFCLEKISTVLLLLCFAHVGVPESRHEETRRPTEQMTPLFSQEALNKIWSEKIEKYSRLLEVEKNKDAGSRKRLEDLEGGNVAYETIKKINPTGMDMAFREMMKGKGQNVERSTRYFIYPSEKSLRHYLLAVGSLYAPFATGTTVIIHPEGYALTDLHNLVLKIRGLPNGDEILKHGLPHKDFPDGIEIKNGSVHIGVADTPKKEVGFRLIAFPPLVEDVDFKKDRNYGFDGGILPKFGDAGNDWAVVKLNKCDFGPPYSYLEVDRVSRAKDEMSGLSHFLFGYVYEDRNYGEPRTTFEDVVMGTSISFAWAPSEKPKEGERIFSYLSPRLGGGMSGAPIIRNRDAKVIGIHFATSKATGVELHEETPPMKGNAIAVSEIVSQLKARKAFIPGLTE